jgi:hypothetical protein
MSRGEKFVESKMSHFEKCACCLSEKVGWLKGIKLKRIRLLLPLHNDDEYESEGVFRIGVVVRV